MVKRVYRVPLTIAGDDAFLCAPHRATLPESLTFAQVAWQQGSRQILACRVKPLPHANFQGVSLIPKILTLKNPGAHATPGGGVRTSGLPRFEIQKIVERVSRSPDIGSTSRLSHKSQRYRCFPRTVVSTDSRKASPVASADIRARGLRSLSSSGMESPILPKNLTFVPSRPAAPTPFCAPEKAHLRAISKKKLMNSEGYPQAQ